MSAAGIWYSRLLNSLKKSPRVKLGIGILGGLALVAMGICVSSINDQDYLNPSEGQIDASGESGKSSVQEQSVADYINVAHGRYEQMVAVHFWRQLIILGIAISLFILVYLLASVLMRNANVGDELLNELRTASRGLVEITSEMARVIGGIGAGDDRIGDRERILGVVAAHDRLFREGVDRIQKQQGLPQDGRSIIQVIGGSAVLALVGYLGLARLQTIDEEIRSLREFMFAQIEERVKERTAPFVSSVKDDVGKIAADAVAVAKKSVEAKTKEAEDLANGIIANLKVIEKDYGWVKTGILRDAAARVEALKSVEQAHELATLEYMHAEQLKKKGQIEDALTAVSLARKALEAITERVLPGSSDDFHNAHTQAMRMSDLELALDIVESGLKAHPDQADLMADSLMALTKIGMAGDAVKKAEEWRRRSPMAFQRGWRPVVFYAEAVVATGFGDEAAGNLEDALESVTETFPVEPRPWAALADVQKLKGRFDLAEETLKAGLGHNPYSQHLNYYLGEQMLRQGRASESRKYLERALEVDYADQFQHSVNQEAVRARLAQCYEAIGRESGDSEERGEMLAKAELLYSHLAFGDIDSASATASQYARSRLDAIQLLRGEEPLAGRNLVHEFLRQLKGDDQVPAIPSSNDEQ